jgi:hypothetical protein
MSRSEKMYGNSPTMERNEEGKMKVTKPEKKEKGEMEHARGNSAGMNEHEDGLPPVARHAMERRDMHARHETEHMMHDHKGTSEKTEMHSRHEKLMKEMHKRHETELKEGVRAPAGEKENKKEQKKEAGGDKPKEPKDKIEKD